MARIGERFNVNKFFVGLLLIFIVIQAGAWFLYNYTDIDVPNIKAGWILFLFLAISAITSVFILGKRLGALQKYDIIFVIVEFLAIVGLFYYLPKYIPQIFSSYSLEIADTIKNSIASVIEITGTSLVST